MVPQFLKPLETISARRGSLSTIFADFVRITACTLSPRHEVDGRSLSIREDEYMDTIRRYDKREVELLTEAYGKLIIEADRHPHKDILGPAWLDCTSKSSKQARGEFYTLPELCEMIAMMSGDVERFIAAGQPVTICEPACGAGSMILSMAKLYAPDHWHLPRFTAVDINPVACDMCFINTTLWSVPCEVICGNFLSPRETDRRFINIHWLRVGEEQRRMFRRLVALATAPTPAPALPEPPPIPQPTPTKTGWIQDDLFAA